MRIAQIQPSSTPVRNNTIEQKGGLLIAVFFLLVGCEKKSSPKNVDEPIAPSPWLAQASSVLHDEGIVVLTPIDGAEVRLTPEEGVAFKELLDTEIKKSGIDVPWVGFDTECLFSIGNEFYHIIVLKNQSFLSIEKVNSFRDTDNQQEKTSCYIDLNKVGEEGLWYGNEELAKKIVGMMRRRFQRAKE